MKVKQMLENIEIKIWCLLLMLNLCFSLDILIVRSDKDWGNQIWIEEIKQKFEPVFEWHECNYSIVLECITVYPDSLLVFDLSDSKMARENAGTKRL